MLPTSGAIHFLSCRYKPGATKAHSWYSTNGSAITSASSSVTLTGTKNEPVTSVTIILPSFGKFISSGAPASGKYPPPIRPSQEIPAPPRARRELHAGAVRPDEKKKRPRMLCVDHSCRNLVEPFKQ